MPNEILPPECVSPRVPGRPDSAGPLAEWIEATGSAQKSDLNKIIAMIRRRFWTIMLSAASVFAAVAVLTFLWPKTYQSVTTILVEQSNPGMNSSALAVLERLGQRNETKTEIELMHSRGVIEAVVDELDRNVDAETNKGMRRPAQIFENFSATRDARSGEYGFTRNNSGGYVMTDTETGEKIAEARPGGRIEAVGLTMTLPEKGLPEKLTLTTLLFAKAVDGVDRQIEVGRVQSDTDLVEIICSDRTAIDAYELCEGISRNYLRMRTDLQRSEAATTAKYLRGQVARLKDQLTPAEDRLEAFTRENNAVALDEQASAGVRQFIEVRGQREQLEAERSSLAGLLRQIDQKDGGDRKYRDLGSFPTFMKNENQIITQLLATLAKLENERSDLALRRTELNPDLAALDNRIAQIERQIGTIATSYEQALSIQIRSLDRSLDKAEARLAEIPAQDVQSARLEHEVNTLGELHRLLETRLREAEVAEAVNLPAVRLLDTATLPHRPASPKPMLNLALGMFLGLGYGLSFALYREFRDTRVRERHEVVLKTKLPVLSMIPRLRRPGPVLAVSPLNYLPVVLQRADRAGETATAARRRKEASKSSLKGREARLEEERQMALDSFYSLAADLKFAGQQFENGPVKTVAITSSSRREGKTFTASNLALVNCSHGFRTLLIDADMRDSGVAMFFDLAPSAPGLSEVLLGSSDVANVLKRFQVEDSQLWVLPSGPPTRKSARLLDSPEFEDLLRRMREDFDVIIIDTPPLNLITDAAAIATKVDAVALVVRAGVTDPDALEITIERLMRARGRVLGVVLNDVKLPSHYASRYHYGRAVEPGSA